MRNRGTDYDDNNVKVPGEIDVQRARRILEELRRRFADPLRPQIELDYLERLLQGFLESQFKTRALSASLTAPRISASENGLVMTSWISAFKPCARSRWSA